MKLSEINFPVFQISKQTTYSKIDNALVVILYDRETEEELYKYIDDKSVLGDTLGKRRLKLKLNGKLLYPLKDAIYFLGDLIKLAKVSPTFIDNSGKIFTYKKVNTVKLKMVSIKEIIDIPTGGSILSIVGIPQRFKTLATVPKTKKYAGVLVSSSGYILYGVYDTLKKDTWRKI